jgi:hypothetical protein
MAIYKITQIFGQTTRLQRQSGWSETWYLDATESTAISKADTLNKRRSGFLTRAASITNTRIQLLGGRSRLLRTVYPGVLGADQDIPQMALSCICLGQGVLNQKNFQLRGIPDGNVDGGEFTPTQGFQTAFAAYGSALVNEGFRFRAIDLTAAQVAIVSVSNIGVFALAAPLVYNVGSFIQFLRAKNTVNQAVNGTYYVSAKVDGQNGTFLDWTGGILQLKGKARVKTFVYPLVAANSLEFTQISVRKVGRPFNLYHGRATKR